MSIFRPMQNDDEARARCDNCGEPWMVGDLEAIENPSERLFAGEVVPAGQCPNCGACCHLEEVTP